MPVHKVVYNKKGEAVYGFLSMIFLKFMLISTVFFYVVEKFG